MSNLVKTSNEKIALEMDPSHKMFGWVFYKEPEKDQWAVAYRASLDAIEFTSILMARLKAIEEYADKYMVTPMGIPLVANEEIKRIVRGEGT